MTHEERLSLLYLALLTLVAVIVASCVVGMLT